MVSSSDMGRMYQCRLQYNAEKAGNMVVLHNAVTSCMQVTAHATPQWSTFHTDTTVWGCAKETHIDPQPVNSMSRCHLQHKFWWGGDHNDALLDMDDNAQALISGGHSRADL